MKRVAVCAALVLAVLAVASPGHAATVIGGLDQSFGSSGSVSTTVGGVADDAYAVARQSDGKLVVAGTVIAGSDDFGVVRYNTDGTLDTAFSGDGKVTTDIFSHSDRAIDVAVQSDGKIVVAGSADTGSRHVVAVVRYNTDGTLDSTFDGDTGNGNGIVTTMTGGDNDYGGRMVIQPDGKIVVTAQAYNGADCKYAMIRYNADGTLDTSFDGDTGTGNGIVATDVGAHADYASAVALQSDGKIVVTGNISTSASFILATVRYNADGTLDLTFDGDSGSGNGIVTTDIGGASKMDFANAVIAQSDGKIVVVGSSGPDFATVRYNADGTLDTTFDGDSGSGNGIVVTDIDSNTDYAYSINVQSDGKLVVTGQSYVGLVSRMAIVRYNSDGTLDTSFDGDGGNGNGIVVINLSSEGTYPFGSVIQSDSRIVVVGYVVASGVDRYFVARITAMPDHVLTVSKGGAGAGTVTSSPSGVSCGAECAFSFAHATSITLTARASTSSVFVGWSGSGCSGKGSCVVAMTDARGVTATFALKTFRLTVTRAGAGRGTVSSSIGGLSCSSTCGKTFTYGTKVTLTAKPARGSVFSGWSGSGCSGKRSCTVTMSQVRTVKATFARSGR